MQICKVTQNIRSHDDTGTANWLPMPQTKVTGQITELPHSIRQGKFT